MLSATSLQLAKTVIPSPFGSTSSILHQSSRKRLTSFVNIPLFISILFLTVLIHGSMKRYGLGMLMCYVLLLVLVVCLWLQVARIIALGIRLNSASLTTAKLIQFFFFAGFILCLDQKDLNIFLIVKPILIE